MNIPQIQIDLSLPPAKRWSSLYAFKDQARQLLAEYARDLGGIEQFQDSIMAYRNANLPTGYAQELTSIARMLDVSEEAILVVNLYYDLIKFIIGCTAFAVDTEQGPLHARNLDWWTEMGLLSSATLVTDFRGAAVGPFQVVAWPGFTGALSGVAPGRFAITLNAVSSNEPPVFATPITYLIRTIFETTHTFAEAVYQLTSTEIASDCLLLVTGTQPGEMVVIERTPTRAALRFPTNGYLIVTNDYLALSSNTTSSGVQQELQQTSCSRFDRTSQLLAHHLPRNATECFSILTDPAIRMRITVQQMVMSAALGLLEVRLPEH